MAGISYGIKGRIITAIIGIAGVLSALAAAAQASGIYALLPARYAWVTTALPIVSLFWVAFSERIQGGASKPEVRAAAEISDRQNVARSNDFTKQDLK